MIDSGTQKNGRRKFMSDRIVQCCYSNLVSKSGVSGWQTAAASPEMTPHMLDVYRKQQDANVASQLPLDENGEPLNMYEMVADGEFIYVTRVTYGLEDVRGRKNNMLAHTYLFPVTREVLENPNEFLTVADENFTGDIEKAKEIRTSFVRKAPYTLSAAMKECGLNEEKYQNLVYCIQEQREQKRPIFIRTTKGEAVIRPLMFCLFSALPFSVRSEISCASALVNLNSNRSLIITSSVPPMELFFDLETGENNVLTERNIKKYERLGYLNYFIQNWEIMDGNLYFEKLEKIAVKLGDQKASKARVLKIAYQMISSESGAETIEEARGKLYEALMAAVQPSVFMDDYIASLLGKINAEGKMLDETVETELLKRLKEETKSAKLQAEGETYLLNKILQAGAVKGSVLLRDIEGEKFDRIARALYKKDGGEAILDEYFADRVPKDANWEEYQKLLDDVSEYCGDHVPKTIEKVEKNCKERFVYEITVGVDLDRTFQKYVELLKYLDTFSQKQEDCEIKAKEQFWDLWEYTGYKSKRNAFYKKMLLDGNKKSDDAKDLIEAVSLIEKGDLKQAFSPLMLFFNRTELRIPKEKLSNQEKLNLDQEIKLFLKQRELSLDKKTQEKLELAIQLDGLSFIGEAKKYVELISQKDYEEFRRQYRTNIDSWENHPKREKLLSYYNKHILRQLEKGEMMSSVSVDVFLTFGEEQYRNPFEFFDAYERPFAGIRDLLNESPEFTVQNSDLLFSDPYADYAEEYLKGEGANREVVKEWMAEVKKQAKQRKKQEKAELKAEKKAEKKGEKWNEDNEEETVSAGAKVLKKLGSLFGRK